MRLLERFSSSLLLAEYPSPAAAPPNLRVFRRKVELSLDVLKQLEKNVNSASTGANSRKKGSAITNNHRVDPLPFESMRMTVPTTDAEVRDAYVKILSQLRNVLEVCGFVADSMCAQN